MAEYKPNKRACFYVVKMGNAGKNIALFALVASKIITEKR